MDYFFLSCLKQNPPTCVISSYDIACQWAKNIDKRVSIYPKDLQAAFYAVTLTYLIPKWHLKGHQFMCRILYSFNFTPHVGRTDGEAPERGWASTNAIANSTKQMGPGSRRDTLDDHFGDYNWKKVTTMGKFGWSSTEHLLMSTLRRHFTAQSQSCGHCPHRTCPCIPRVQCRPAQAVNGTVA